VSPFTVVDGATALASPHRSVFPCFLAWHGIVRERVQQTVHLVAAFQPAGLSSPPFGRRGLARSTTVVREVRAVTKGWVVLDLWSCACCPSSMDKRQGTRSETFILLYGGAGGGHRQAVNLVVMRCRASWGRQGAETTHRSMKS
jgi:hypothetical protein